MVCNDLNQWSFYLEMGREIKNQSTSDWLVGEGLISLTE